MFPWLAKTLWSQKISVFSSAAGVAAALLLVITMDAAFVGESNHIVAYIEHTKPDVWVMQRGVSNMHMANTFVLDWKAQRVSELEGVVQATPILYVNTIVHAAEHKLFSYVIGLPADGQRAGPWSVTAGKSHPQEGEIILPQVLADISGVSLGDSARIADMTFTIAGFTEGTFSMANSIAFVAFSDLEDLMSISGTISFILVDAAPGQDAAELAARIEASVDKVNAVTQEAFIKNDFQIALLMGVEIIFFMTIVGTVLAALIVAFTAYSQVARRRKELAIIKALGYRNSALYLAVITQSLIITGLALMLALIAAVVLLPAISVAVPMVALDVTTGALIDMALTASLVAIVAAVVPAHFVARVDPVSAFKV